MTDLDALLRIWARYKRNKERYGLNIVRGPITLYERRTGTIIEQCEYTMSRALTLLYLYELSEKEAI